MMMDIKVSETIVTQTENYETAKNNNNGTDGLVALLQALLREREHLTS